MIVKKLFSIKDQNQKWPINSFSNTTQILAFVSVLAIIISIFIFKGFELYWHYFNRPFRYKAGLFIPDAYYYFNYADSMANGNFYNWNGVYPSNGFHPLWALILTPVYIMTNSPETAIDIVIGLSYLIYICFSMVVFAYTSEVENYIIGGISVSAFSYWSFIFFNGLESGVALLLLIILIFMIHKMVDFETFNLSDLIKTGTVASFTVLARLDLVILLLPLLFWFWYFKIIKGVRNQPIKIASLKASVFAAPPIIFVGGYMVLNLIFTGLWQPVSAAKKSTFPIPMNPIISITGHSWNNYQLGLGLIGVALVGYTVRILCIYIKKKEYLSSTYDVILSLLIIGSFLHLLYHSLFTWPPGIGDWYFYPYLIPAILSAVTGIQSGLTLVSGLNIKYFTNNVNFERYKKSFFVILLVIVLLIPTAVYVDNVTNDFYPNYDPKETREYHVIEAAEFADEHYPRGTVFYSGIDGQFSYLTDFKTYHAKGLSNTPSYLHTLERLHMVETGSPEWVEIMSQYAKHRDIDYYISYGWRECMRTGEYEFLIHEDGVSVYIMEINEYIDVNHECWEN